MTSSATPTSSSSTFDRLAAQGYVVLRQFLAPAECAELRAMTRPPAAVGRRDRAERALPHPHCRRASCAACTRCCAARRRRRERRHRRALEHPLRQGHGVRDEAGSDGTTNSRGTSTTARTTSCRATPTTSTSHPVPQGGPCQVRARRHPRRRARRRRPAFARRFPGGATTYKCPDGPAPYYCRFDCEDLARTRCTATSTPSRASRPSAQGTCCSFG